MVDKTTFADLVRESHERAALMSGIGLSRTSETDAALPLKRVNAQSTLRLVQTLPFARRDARRGKVLDVRDH